MDNDIKTRFLEIVDLAVNEKDAKQRVLLLLFAMLFHPSSYQMPKARAVTKLATFIHWALSELTPLALMLEDKNGLQLSDCVTVYRAVGEEGHYFLKTVGLFPEYEASELNSFLSADEMAEVLDDDIRFDVFFSPFWEQLRGESDLDQQLNVAILGIIFIAELGRMKPIVHAVSEYLVFDFSPISALFDDEDDVYLLPPDGYIRRSRAPRECL